MACGQSSGGVEAARVWTGCLLCGPVVLIGPAPSLCKTTVSRHQSLEWIIRNAEPVFRCFNRPRLHQGGQGQTARLLEEVTALDPHAGSLCGPAGGLCDRGCSIWPLRSALAEGCPEGGFGTHTGSTVGWMAAAGWAVAAVLALAMSRSPKGAQRAAGPAITGSTPVAPA